jgi:hypothetical protein
VISLNSWDQIWIPLFFSNSADTENCRLLDKRECKLPTGPKEIGKRSRGSSCRKRISTPSEKVHCNMKWDVTIVDAKLLSQP